MINMEETIIAYLWTVCLSIHSPRFPNGKLTHRTTILNLNFPHIQCEFQVNRNHLMSGGCIFNTTTTTTATTTTTTTAISIEGNISRIKCRHQSKLLEYAPQPDVAKFPIQKCFIRRKKMKMPPSSFSSTLKRNVMQISCLLGVKQHHKQCSAFSLSQTCEPDVSAVIPFTYKVYFVSENTWLFASQCK